MAPRPGPPNPPSSRRFWLKRADQAVVAGVVLLALLLLAAWHFTSGGWRGGLIEIDQAPPLTAEFKVDINEASWPELVQLPEVGETLARRIVERRERLGPFRSVEELRQVPGIGPKTMERLRPYILPLPDPDSMAGP